MISMDCTIAPIPRTELNFKQSVAVKTWNRKLTTMEDVVLGMEYCRAGCDRILKPGGYLWRGTSQDGCRQWKIPPDVGQSRQEWCIQQQGLRADKYRPYLFLLPSTNLLNLLMRRCLHRIKILKYTLLNVEGFSQVADRSPFNWTGSQEAPHRHRLSWAMHIKVIS